MANKYSAEFKEQAVRRVLAGESAAKLARVLASMLTRYIRGSSGTQQRFGGSGQLRDEDGAVVKCSKERLLCMAETAPQSFIIIFQLYRTYSTAISQ